MLDLQNVHQTLLCAAQWHCWKVSIEVFHIMWAHFELPCCLSQLTCRKTGCGSLCLHNKHILTIVTQLMLYGHNITRKTCYAVTSYQWTTSTLHVGVVECIPGSSTMWYSWVTLNYHIKHVSVKPIMSTTMGYSDCYMNCTHTYSTSWSGTISEHSCFQSPISTCC